MCYSPTGRLYGASALSLSQILARLTSGVRREIVAQVEFYFGDANYPKDKFLLKEAKKGKDGFIALKTVTGFARMKKLTRSWRSVAHAVRDSDVVELSPDGRKLRRRHPLPAPKVHASWRKSVVVEGLTDTSIDAIKARCALHEEGAGAVTLVRVVDPQSLPPDLAAYMNAPGAKRKNPALKGRRPVVVVEYDSDAAAVTACETLNEPGNWRSGLKVTLLWHRALPSQAAKKKTAKDQKKEATAMAPVEPLKVTRPRLQLTPKANGGGTSSPGTPRKLEGRTRDPLGPDGTKGFGVRGKRAPPMPEGDAACASDGGEQGAEAVPMDDAAKPPAGQAQVSEV